MANDLLINPSFVFDQTPQYKTLISEFENGAEQRRSKRSSAITEYRLIYKNISSTDKDTIVNLFGTKKGAYSSLTWTHPISSSTLTVRFKEDSLTYTNTSYGLYDLEFTLVTIL